MAIFSKAQNGTGVTVIKQKKTKSLIYELQWTFDMMVGREGGYLNYGLNSSWCRNCVDFFQASSWGLVRLFAHSIQFLVTGLFSPKIALPDFLKCHFILSHEGAPLRLDELWNGKGVWWHLRVPWWKWVIFQNMHFDLSSSGKSCFGDLKYSCLNSVTWCLQQFCCRLLRDKIDLRHCDELINGRRKKITRCKSFLDPFKQGSLPQPSHQNFLSWPHDIFFVALLMIVPQISC